MKSTAKWNRRDDGGVAVSSGVYFVRLATGDGDLVRKVVRLPAGV